MSEGFQIEIPCKNCENIVERLAKFTKMPQPALDEDDDFANVSIPFGRPQNFQFGQQSFSSSPLNNFSSTLQQNWELNSGLPESSHARGDSFASESSSFGHGKPPSSFNAPKSSSSGHATSLSNATTYSTPSRKSSFASIRNAFKTGKLLAQDAPPVPPLESNPAIRNPFNRTVSARPFVTPGQASGAMSRRRPSAPGPTASYQVSRSPQLSTSISPVTHARGTSNFSGPATVRKGSRGVVNHSPASSIAHSDQDHMNNLSSTLIPRGPNAPSSFHRPAPSFVSETSPEVEPSTPAEYALNVVLTHFVTNAERRIERLLQDRLVS